MIYPLAVGFLTLLVMGVSCLIGFLSVAVRINVFYCMLIPVLLGELSLGAALLWQSFAKARNLVIPAGLTIAAFLYCAFTLVMIVPFAMGIGFVGMLTTQLVGVTFWIILLVVFVLSGHHADTPDPRFAVKTHFKLELERFRHMHRELVEGAPELKEKIERLAEDFRLASDSPAGAEEVDAQLRDELTRLHAAGESGDVKACLKAIEELQSLNTWRQNLIREMR